MYILLFSFFYSSYLTYCSYRLAHLPVREALEVEAKDYD